MKCVDLLNLSVSNYLNFSVMWNEGFGPITAGEPGTALEDLLG